MLCPVNVTSVRVIHELRKNGYKIVIHTSRVSAERKITVNYLAFVNCEYDELVMDKPPAFLYIDDNGFRFTNWKEVFEFLTKIKMTE
jgi:hypothetical protein